MSDRACGRADARRVCAASVWGQCMQRVGAAYYVRPSPALSTRMVSGECARKLVLILSRCQKLNPGNWLIAKWARGSCQLVQPGGVDGVHESPSPCTVAGFVDASFASYIPCPLPRSFIGTEGRPPSSAFLKSPRPTRAGLGRAIVSRAHTDGRRFVEGCSHA